jgi:hypothetical protein
LFCHRKDTIADANAAGNRRSLKARARISQGAPIVLALRERTATASFVATAHVSTGAFREKLRENKGAEFWEHVKTMSLEGDKLVVTTQAE